jgi:hypothetical protein
LRLGAFRQQRCRCCHNSKPHRLHHFQELPKLDPMGMVTANRPLIISRHFNDSFHHL